MSEQTILVTGGAGFIGSHACKALAHAGYRPVVFDDLSNGHAEAVKWGPLVVGDVRDAAALEACMISHDVSAVIHFAGLIEVGRSVSAPDVYWDVNLGGTAAVMGAMRRAGVERIVFSSTAAVYGQPAASGPDLLSEDLPLQPINPYGDSKLAAERLIAGHAKAFGLKGVALRYFNAAGSDPDGDVGEAHRHESHLIPLAIDAALGRGPGLTVFGEDFDTPDGCCVRDYVHVSDLARAHVLALDAEPGSTGFLALNLGLGQGSSVREVIASVNRTVGRRTPHLVGPRRDGDPARLVADPRRAWAALGWRPVHTELDGIVASAAAWRRRPAFGPNCSVEKQVA